MARLCKQQIRLPGSRQIRDTVAAVEESRTLVQRKLLALLLVGFDGARLVVAEMAALGFSQHPCSQGSTGMRPFIAVDNFPHAIGLGAHVIRDDRDLAGGVGAEQLLEESADQRLHAAREDDDGDVLLAAPGVEGGEARVEGDVCDQLLGALLECFGEGDRVEHVFEAFAEAKAVVDDFDAEEKAMGAAEAELVGEEVVACGG